MVIDCLTRCPLAKAAQAASEATDARVLVACPACAEALERDRAGPDGPRIRQKFSASVNLSAIAHSLGSSATCRGARKEGLSCTDVKLPACAARRVCADRWQIWRRIRRSRASCVAGPKTMTSQLIGLSSIRDHRSDVLAPMGKYRFATSAIYGPWRRSRKHALLDALDAGHAHKKGGQVRLLRFTRIEEQREG